jgi:Zn-dependent peptidase ImmA (M78 family)
LAATVIELEKLLDYAMVQPSYPVLQVNSDQSIDEQAEDAALMLRQRLGVGIGPISNLEALLELELGLRIFERPLPSVISGACSFHKDYGGFVLVNARHWPERRHLTVAHEAAHGMVSPGEPSVLLDSDVFVTKEDRFCDAFGRALLMPAATVRRKASELKGAGPLTVRHVLMLSSYFRVSIEAMGRRMEALGLAPRGTFESLRSRGLGRRHLLQAMQESELDTTYGSFTPKFMFLVSEAYARGLLSEQQIAERLDLDIVAVRKMLEAVHLDENERRTSAA